MKQHIAIYCRVSSGQQSTKSQEPDLKRWIAAQELPVRWYRDKFTGKTMNRSGWNDLQAAIDAGKVATVVCWRLDRLGRTAKGLSALFADLNERGVGLVSIREGIDLSTPAGRMMAHVIASMAQYETEIRADRVLAGQQAARAKGETWGGRKTGSSNKRILDKVDTVVSLFRVGRSISGIKKDTGISRPTIYKIIRDSEVNGALAPA